jgi:hypothetical protein
MERTESQPDKGEFRRLVELERILREQVRAFCARDRLSRDEVHQRPR